MRTIKACVMHQCRWHFRPLSLSLYTLPSSAAPPPRALSNSLSLCDVSVLVVLVCVCVCRWRRQHRASAPANQPVALARSFRLIAFNACLVVVVHTMRPRWFLHVCTTRSL